MPAIARLPICDTLRSLLSATASRRILFIHDTVVANPGGRGPWPRQGCWIRVVDSLARGGTQTDDIERWFRARGWQEAPYAADGPDGTMFGLVRAPELCVVEGHWDGGDDSDTTYVPRPGDELTVKCVPSAPSDTVQWMTGSDITLRPNTRLKLTARVDYGMNLFSARRSLSAFR